MTSKNFHVALKDSPLEVLTLWKIRSGALPLYTSKALNIGAFIERFTPAAINIELRILETQD